VKGKLVFELIVFICLICSISVTSAAQVTKIGDGRDPAIYESKVTWADLSGIIHLYDLSTKKDIKLSSSAAAHPDIFGNKIVWFDKEIGVPRITIYDIPSGSKTFVTKDVDDRSVPHIYSNYLVWSANSSVYLNYMSPSKQTASTQTKIAYGDSPDIYDTKVTYVYDSGDRPQVYVYDIATKQTTRVSLFGDCYTPHVYGNKVIWSDFNTREGYISMYDIVTKKTIAVTSDNTDSGDPNNPDCGCDTGSHTDIYGDKIVYGKTTDDCLGKAGIYVYDITSTKSIQLLNYPKGVHTTPEIYGNTVVWGMDGYNTQNSDTGIYMCTVESNLTADFSADKFSGKAPLSVQFTSKTTGNPTDYYWVFEPSNSSDWNSHHAVTAVHTFKGPGIYTVSLTVTKGADNITITKNNYITVK
jgi:beta propeller repeat protein